MCNSEANGLLIPERAICGRCMSEQMPPCLPAVPQWGACASELEDMNAVFTDISSM